MIGAERLSSLESMLAGDHLRLERAFQAIVTRAAGGDVQQLECEWLSFQSALLQHLDAEEKNMIPELAKDRPGEAQALLDEHANIRIKLLQLGVDLDLTVSGPSASRRSSRRCAPTPTARRTSSTPGSTVGWAAADRSAGAATPATTSARTPRADAWPPP